jgi:hypothetical protein
MERKRILNIQAAAFTVALVWIAPMALAAGTAEQKCEGGKNDAAGKYNACLGKAQKAFVATGDSIKYADAVARCEGKLINSWGKLEAAAVSAGTTCPSVGDQSPIEDFVDACSDSIAVAVAGGGLGPDPISCAADLDTCGDDLATCDSDLSTCLGDVASCEGDLAGTEADLATCDGDLANCQASNSRIPRTGQTTCTNDAGTVIACAGSGRDGEFQAGDAPSFTDNGNGTITDNITGLMWEKLSDDGSIHDKDLQFAGLTAAIGKATTLNGASFAGFTDWRVPNLRELASLPVYENYNPAVPTIFRSPCIAGCTVLTCSCVKSNIYFTSTDYIGYRPACWKINMTDGDIYAGDKVDTHYVRLVRTAN